jgi:hypothetical protein
MDICAPASVAFSQLPHLKKHMLSIHGKDKPYMCSHCKDFFKTKQELQTHSLSCSKDDSLTTDQALSESVRLNSLNSTKIII